MLTAYLRSGPTCGVLAGKPFLEAQAAELE